jgi:hypothetical protein
MSARISFAGVSRLDAGDEDGIHLLWDLPGNAAWAVDGFDIQRRDSHGREPRETCFDLTPAMMALLHTSRRLTIPFGDITFRDTACPGGLPDIPDEPAPGEDRTGGCLDLERDEPIPDRVEENGLAISRDQDSGGSFDRVEIDGRLGMHFEEMLEIEVTERATVIELSAWLAADDVVVQVLDDDGQIVAENVVGAVSEVVREIVVAHGSIVRVRLLAKGGKGVLFRACRHDFPEACWDFDEPPGTRRPNPFIENGATFTVRDFGGALEPFAEVVRFHPHTGLSLADTLTIRLGADARGATLTLVHFSDSPTIRGFDAAGTLLFEHATNLPGGDVVPVSVAAEGLRTVEIVTPQAETLLLRACFHGLGPGTGGGDPGRKECVVYDVELNELNRAASLTLGTESAYVIAMSGSEAIAAHGLSGAAPVVAEFTADGRGIDRLLAYTTAPSRTMRICVEPFPDPREEEREWAGEQFLVKGLQMPFRRVDPSLTTADDEWAKAETHLLPGETVPREHFDEVATYASAVTDAPDPHRAPFMTARSRGDPAQRPIDVAAWPFLLSLTTDATWRRIVALGFLDQHNLTPGQAYDYRISARFRRLDVEEEVFGFHTIPTGMRLPGRVSLGALGLHMPGRGTVEFVTTDASGAIEAGRRALAVEDFAFLGIPSLTIELPQPTDHVVLELEGGDSYEAPSLASAMSGGPASFSGSFAGTGREDLVFPAPVDAIRIERAVRLFAVRLPAGAAGLDPHDKVERSSVIYGVVHEPTPPPAPPAFLGTVNLQTPAPPPDATPGQRTAPDNLGFRLYWPPPPPSGSFTGVWPTDLAASPPSDALFFNIDRRDHTAGGPWEPLADDAGPTRFFASRGAAETPDAIAYGSDLLSIFPDRHLPASPVPTIASAEDALTVPQRGGPRPGTLFQYRIRSVDVIGRDSVDRDGSIVRLEKRRPPPAPSGPIDPDVPAAAGEPKGVRARVLRADEPGLSIEDVADLAGAANAVVVEWGWHDNQRREDPYAEEFRIYWQDPPFDTVAGEVTGPHGTSGPNLTVPVTFDRLVPADRMVGLALYSGGLPFRIVGQTAGTTSTLTVATLATRPTARPVPGAFVLHPPLDGSEMAPAAWDERVAVVPIGAATAYRHVIRDRLTLSPDRPRHRVWVGVSAADREPYRPDTRTTGANAGRPGNESNVAATDAIGRYVGQPAFTPPALLEDVPEIVTAEPLQGGIEHLLDLAADLPAGLVAAGEPVVVERMNLSAITTRITATATGARFTPPEGAVVDYSPAAPADQSALVAAIRAGQPGAIPGKFVRAILAAAGTAADPLWEAALPGTVPFGTVTVSFPADAARYVFRVRLADRGGRRSVAGAVTGHIYRVPDLAPPSAPEIAPGAVSGADVSVTFRTRAQFDLTHVAVFDVTAAAGTRFGDLTAQPAEVLRTPNLRGAYPDDGIRLRLADGRLLDPTVIDLATATSEPPDVVTQRDIPVGIGQQAAIWALAVNRDGAVSGASGPILIGGAPATPVVPDLSVARSGGTDTLSWGAAAADVEVAAERSTDAGATWERVSGWFRPAARTISLPAVGGANTRYRLKARSAVAAADGPDVQPT